MTVKWKVGESCYSSMCRIGELTVHLSRINFKWFLTCYPFFEVTPLAGSTLEEAQCQGLAKIQNVLQEVINEICAT